LKAWGENYHSISIKLADPKLVHAKIKLSYRVGYYIDAPTPAPKKTKPLTSTPESAPTSPLKTAMQAAMQYGAPQPTQIVMKVLVQPKSEKPEDDIAKDNEPTPKIRGPYLRYSVDYAVDARHVAFVANQDRTFKATVEFAIVVYDDQGQVVNMVNRSADAKVDAAHRAAIVKTGMHFHQEVSVPAKGHYWLRIGVHDRTNNGLGAVEVNLENVKRTATATPQKPS
jgi:hypothetical protein